jgi:hypothetical protein
MEADGQQAGQAGQAQPAQQAQQAEELVLELVRDDRLLESLCAEGEEAPSDASAAHSDGADGSPSLRRQLLALLWNHAARHLASGQDYAAAEAFFLAVLPLLAGSDASGDGKPTQAVGNPDRARQGSNSSDPSALSAQRSLALCCLGAGQHAR